MASLATKAKYLRDGHRLLVRAETRYPMLPELDALLAEAGEGDVLMAATIRRYLPAYASALDVLSFEGNSDQEQCALARSEIRTLLDARRGVPDPLRTAAAKNIATKEEAEKTFVALKAHALLSKDPVPVAAALYVFVVPRIAIRPIELVGARIVGKTLIVRNAKRRPRQKPERKISLKRFADSFIEAVKWLVILADAGISLYNDPERDFEMWRNKLASCLARASKHVCGDDRRLSLYSFRHIGIATWKAAGFSAETIAALAGHLLLSSAGRYYAPSKAGWVNEAVLAELPELLDDLEVAPVSLESRGVKDRSDSTYTPNEQVLTADPPALPKKSAGQWDVPMPVPRKPVARSSGGEALFQSYKADLERKLRSADENAAKLKGDGGMSSLENRFKPYRER